MLGKIIKYDLKSLSRFLIVIHAIMLLFAIVGRFFVTSPANWNDENFILIFSILAFFILVTITSFATSIIIAVHFYKDLFSKHGYLSWTLPVSSGQHLAAKTIAALIWTLIDYLIVVASLFIFFAVPSLAQKGLLEEFSQEFGTSFVFYIIMISALAIIGSFCGVLTIYFSIVVGQLFSNHRVLGAIVVYFAVSTITELIMLVVMFTGSSNSFNYMISNEEAAFTVTHLNPMLVTTAISSLCTSIILYLISYFIMKKRLNLN